VEVILGRTRRRWTVEQKRALVAEAMSPGASVNSVAKRHDMNAALLFSWRKQYRDELTASQPAAPMRFAEVMVAEAPRESVPAPGESRVNVEFASGVRMTLLGRVDPALAAALTRVLARR
jgi:transposase